MENKRAISTAFLDNLKKSSILEIVKNDRTLDIELRGDIITVYYRGCAILTVLENGKFKKMMQNIIHIVIKMGKNNMKLNLLNQQMRILTNI